MYGRPLVVTALLACIVVATASAQTRTTAPNVFVKIHVTLTDSKVVVSPRRASRGTDVQFFVKNVGTKPHTFTFGTVKRRRGSQTGFTRLVKPGRKQILLLYLNYRGVLPYYGDHGKVQGTFVIGPE